MHASLLPIFGLPIHTAYMIYASLLLAIFAVVMKGRLRLVPGRVQSVVEIIIEGIAGIAESAMGPGGRRLLPVILTLFMFILVSNFFGLIPGFYPPTANYNTNFGLALVVFLMTHIIGIIKHRHHYIKHFLGPVILIAPLMLIIELIGHAFRPLTLTVRLFGNIYGHELLVGELVNLMPYTWALLAFVTIIGILVNVIQALVFSLLTMSYFGGALEEAH